MKTTQLQSRRQRRLSLDETCRARCDADFHHCLQLRSNLMWNNAVYNVCLSVCLSVSVRVFCGVITHGTAARFYSQCHVMKRHDGGGRRWRNKFNAETNKQRQSYWSLSTAADCGTAAGQHAVERRTRLQRDMTGWCRDSSHTQYTTADVRTDDSLMTYSRQTDIQGHKNIRVSITR